MTGLVSSWLIVAAIYVLFAGQFSTDELVAAAVCGLVAALWWISIRRAATVQFRFEKGAFGACSRAVGGLPSATAKTGAVLLRAIVVRTMGRTSATAFIKGPQDSPFDAGRRAVTVLGLSLAPNSFVLRTPQGRDEIDLHELAIMPSRDDARWPI